MSNGSPHTAYSVSARSSGQVFVLSRANEEGVIPYTLCTHPVH